jgi:hypothetical protein
VARPPLPGEFEHVAMPDQVRLHVGRRVFEAVADPGLCAEVDDGVEFNAVGGAPQRLNVGKIDALEAEPVGEVLFKPVEPCALE